MKKQTHTRYQLIYALIKPPQTNIFPASLRDLHINIKIISESVLARVNTDEPDLLECMVIRHLHPMQRSP